MKTRLSNKQKWLKQINLTPDDELYIGIDAHKKSLHTALWLNHAPAIDFVTPADNKKLIATIEKLRPASNPQSLALRGFLSLTPTVGLGIIWPEKRETVTIFSWFFLVVDIFGNDMMQIIEAKV